MKTRILSALVAFLIFIPIFLKGGILFNITVYVLSLIAVYEFIKIKESKKELPTFIKFISYVLITLFVLFNTNNSNIIFSIDYRIITGLFLSLFMPVVIYHNNGRYSINDALYLISGIMFLGISFALLITVREFSLSLIIYLFVITIITDTYAYITGYLIGKHKLAESISPKKTWEGLIGGTIFGVFAGCVYYHNVVDPSFSISALISITIFLSIVGQLGDLVFSAIKRYFNKKDFSNIMPGHGGVLDRMDSIIFVLLGFMFFITII